MQINIEENQKEIKEHGSYSFPLNVAVEHIESYEQGAFLWHWHPEIEITKIVSGEMEYHINEKIYNLEEGEGMFGNSRTLHAGYRRDRKECTYLSITFHPRLVYGYEGSVFHSKYVEPLVDDSSFAALKLEKDIEWHQDILRRMVKIRNLWMNSRKIMRCRSSRKSLGSGIICTGNTEKDRMQKRRAQCIWNVSGKCFLTWNRITAVTSIWMI